MLKKSLLLSPLDIERADLIWFIRLIKLGNKIVLFDSILTEEQDSIQHITTFNHTILNESKQTRLPYGSIRHLLPSPPRWDVIARKDQSYRFVIEEGGGAITKLKIANKKGMFPLTTNYEFESFTRPRFIKEYSDESKLLLTAISDGNKFVVFPSQVESEKIKYTDLGNWSNGFLVKIPGGYLLIAKRNSPGDMRYYSSPGKLEFIKLDDNLQKSKEIIKPLGENIIYEFDADVIIVDKNKVKIIVSAIGEKDTFLNLYDEVGRVISDSIELDGNFAVTNLSQPAVVILNTDTIYLSMIDKYQEKNARLLVGSLIIN